jgi:hypothetical protein
MLDARECTVGLLLGLQLLGHSADGHHERSAAGVRAQPSELLVCGRSEWTVLLLGGLSREFVLRWVVLLWLYCPRSVSVRLGF